jgi:glycyl-tRNA synthetase beta chain
MPHSAPRTRAARGEGAGRARAGQTARLVFEIGTEELPPAAAWEGARQLRDNAVAVFEAARIPIALVLGYSTPRRLVLIVEGVATRQQDLIREVRGPAARIAFGPDGGPTQAAEGFARAQGVPTAALERRQTPQGEYVFAVRREPGAPTVGVLATVLPSLALGLAFPKPMRWGTGSVRFARPVRWILALLGPRVVSCEFAGIRAGRRTTGHRILRPDAVTVASADVYGGVLRRSFVLLDPDERRTRIVDECTRAAHGEKGRPILDPDLIEETVQLVEWPTAFAGRFAAEFLALPREVLITVMQHHQKYFAVEDSAGHLLPAFVAVRNGGTRGLDVVRQGNEWVLRARLSDARFFFEEDRKRSLASRVGELQDLVYHEKLGTMWEKTRRLEKLARATAPMLRLGSQAAAHLERAAQLSKADLMTLMVRELPELQGVMGGIYARLDGEPEPVAQAIGEQYLPRGSTLPRSEVGAALALLDKADTLLGALAAGLIPSGSQDPYGLRRAAQGIVTVILDRGLHLSARNLAVAVLDAYGIQDAARRAAAVDAGLDLLRQRLRATLIESGISYDTVDATLASDADDLADAAARVRALWAFRQRPEFARVYTAFDRAARILPRDFSGEIRETLIATQAERDLLEAVRRMQEVEAVRALRDTRGGGRGAVPENAADRYTEALHHLAGLADPVDRFFTDVLVMDPDPVVRANRLALLARVVTLIRPIADLSRVVVGEGKAAAAS